MEVQRRAGADGQASQSVAEYVPGGCGVGQQKFAAIDCDIACQSKGARGRRGENHRSRVGRRAEIQRRSIAAIGVESAGQRQGVTGRRLDVDGIAGEDIERIGQRSRDRRFQGAASIGEGDGSRAQRRDIAREISPQLMFVPPE